MISSHSIWIICPVAISIVASKSSIHRHVVAKEDNPIPKLIIDADPGVDDAFALAMAFAQHKLEKVKIMALTFSNGNCEDEDGIINMHKLLFAANISDVRK